MDTFWLDPPPANDPTRATRLWDAVVAHMQPASRRVVRPFRRARILIRTLTDVDIVPAVWGLVPTWATSGERREVASRHALLDAEMVPGSSVTGDLWAAVEPPRRCLIPATGWTATGPFDVLAFQPESSPVTFAGLCNTVVVDGKSITTFGVFYREKSVDPYNGTRVPIIVRVEDRARWLRGSPAEARGMLRPPLMRVVGRTVRSTGTRDEVLYGPGYVDAELSG
jgi:putative SOS response-associated peptidase YedK